MLLAFLPDFRDGVAPVVILLAAIVIDAITGDPAALYRRLLHPVALMGRLGAWFEARLNRPGARARGRFLGGLIAGVAVVGAAAAIGFALTLLFRRLPAGWIAEGVVASTLLAMRGLHDAVRDVARALESSLAEGRRAVAHIVGRDVEALDGAGVARAAIESLAESASDGVVAPVFWYLVLGLPGLCAYKAINTLDSMIGHKDARFRDFGRAAARLDDAANWVPARLTGALLCIATVLHPDASARAAWRAMTNDAAQHDSPNAGWPEAAMAGALGLALGGPRAYDGEAVASPWLGTGRKEASVADIRGALSLYRGAMAALIAALAAGAFL